MNTRSLWFRRRKRRLISGGVVALAILASCAFLRIRHPRDIEAYLGMARECHPVWRQFAFRHFGSGDSAADLLKRFPASRREEFGRYGIYRYHLGDSNGIPFTSLAVVTRDGKLLSAGAGSCTWRFTFFHKEDAGLDQQYAVFLKERHERIARQHLGRLEMDLQTFYLKYTRWPTNQEEFSFFVTHSPSVTTNDLGITLIKRDDGVMDITLVEFPNEKRSVAIPTRKDQP